MSPESPTWEIREGDVLERLREMPDESVHCVVTSPPYWGLRDYGEPGQIGLEPTPEEYVEKMVEVFREVRRVLRGDGTLWLNLGDSYVASRGQGIVPGEGGSVNSRASFRRDKESVIPDRGRVLGMKPKDLVGIPWRVAFALQADGWWLRSDIIWAKPNPMPESVTDRPTKAHEYVFLLTKSARYFYDADAIREEHTSGENTPEGLAARLAIGDPNGKRGGTKSLNDGKGRTKPPSRPPGYIGHIDGRNKRTVWTIATKPYPEAHFATFPPELPRICIKAGTSERGCCAECGAPWERVVEHEKGDNETANRPKRTAGMDSRTSTLSLPNGPKGWAARGGKTTTTGWQPTCDHKAATVPCVVLDPFSGAGTTGVEALALGRSKRRLPAIQQGIRVSPESAGSYGFGTEGDRE